MIRIFKNWRTGMFLFVTCFVANQLIAQSKQITGTVTSSDGNQPVQGVTVTEKGTKNSVATDTRGQYRITVDGKANALVFSSISFISFEAPINGRTVIDAALLPQVTVGEDVVVVGYSSIKRKDLTGSVSSISSKQLKDIPLSSAAEALQ